MNNEDLHCLKNAHSQRTKMATTGASQIYAIYISVDIRSS